MIKAKLIYQKAVTEGKSAVVAMTESATAANKNWDTRNSRPPTVPGMPWRSIILTRGSGTFLAPSVCKGGASTGCTAPWLKFISLENIYLPELRIPQLQQREKDVEWRGKGPQWTRPRFDLRRRRWDVAWTKAEIGGGGGRSATRISGSVGAP